MTTISLRILAFFVTVELIGACQGKKDKIELDQEVTIFIDNEEPQPVQIAAQTLAGDFEKIFGNSVNVVNSIDQCNEQTIFIGYRNNRTSGDKLLLDTLSATESFSIRIVKEPYDHVSDAIVLQGTDKRGAVYAIYHFAQEFLGIDPLYYWTNQKPEKSEMVTIPYETDIYVPSPDIENRGWFINDEDLLTGWSDHPTEGIGIETWEKVYEALLRLKGNMIIPGTHIFPDEPRIQLAVDYGLKITQHHHENLGLNTFRWPDDVPYSFTKYPEILMSAYENAIQAYPVDAELLWVVGHRGKHDRSFWFDDPYAPESDSERAKILQDVIESQVELIKKYDEDPEFYFNAWAETMDFIEKDLLILPEEVRLIFPDNGFGIIRDNGRMNKGDGIYYHTAMFIWRGSQLCELVPLERIKDEFSRAVKAGATNYLLVNTSDLRPVVMTTRAIMEFAWNYENWIENEQAPREYLEKWCTQKFGEEASEEVASIYRSFFDLPVKSGEKDFERFQDVAYQKICRTQLYHLVTGKSLLESKQYLGPDIPDKYLDPDNLLKVFGPSVSDWESLYERAREVKSLVPADKQDFYHDHVIQQIAIHNYSTKMIIDIANMLLAEDNQDKLGYLDSALTHIDSILEHQRKAEHGYWKGFYNDDRLAGVQHTREVAEAYKLCLKGNCEFHREQILNLDLRIFPVIKSYQGDRTVDMDVPDEVVRR